MNGASLFVDVERHVCNLFVPPDEALAAVEQSLIDEDMPRISVSPAEGKFLQLLASLGGAENILEIGTLAAYSTIWMARALSPLGRLITIEANPDYAAVARRNLEIAELTDRVTVRIGRGVDVLPVIEAEGVGPFDLVFIDADKPPYTEYFQWALRLSRPGTLIVADNVIREGEILNAKSTDEMVTGVQRFNAALAASQLVSAIILQTVGSKGHDGMALALVR